MLARMVTLGNRVADVGCDHGFLSIHLVLAGISPGVIAMDVRKGPLDAAREHIAKWGLEAYIQTRQSDGLCGLFSGEVDTAVCAGMGGPLMERILTQSSEKAKQLKELILQPQSEIPEFRRFLREAGYLVTDEDMVCDGGKYYFAMRAVPEAKRREDMEEDAKLYEDLGGDADRCGELGENARWCVNSGEEAERFDKFGEKLLRAGNPVLEQYLRRQEAMFKKLAGELDGGATDRTQKRLAEVQRELTDIRWAFQFFV